MAEFSNINKTAQFPNNITIAQILKEDLDLSYDEWRNRIFIPVKPIIDLIISLVREQIPDLDNPRIYKRMKKDAVKGRSRNASIRWRYKSISTSSKKDINIFIQFSDYHEDRKQTLFWGVSWWGSASDSRMIHHFFETISGGENIIHEDTHVGAGGTSIVWLVKKYKADQFNEMNHDIISECVSDIKMIFEHMNSIEKISTVKGDSDEDIEDASKRELPNMIDIERAYSRLRNMPSDMIEIDDILDAVEEEFRDNDRPLILNWREITKQNIVHWFRRK